VTNAHDISKDALLSKKPVQGFKCATCDNELVNMESMPAKYYNWKKMPLTGWEVVSLLY